MRQVVLIAGIASYLAATACASWPLDRVTRRALTSADSLGVMVAVVGHAAAMNVGRWAGRAPMVFCVGGASVSLEDLRHALPGVAQELRPVTECGMHSSAEPPLAPLVRHLSTLRSATILDFTEFDRRSATVVAVTLRWEAGYHYGGPVRCTVVKPERQWSIDVCASVASDRSRDIPR